MKVTPTQITDVLLIEPVVFGDDRGFFYESFNQRVWRQETGMERSFVQNNHSRSLQGVLRGIHYQIRQPQGKLVRAVVGEVYDVAVDLRKSSPTFGKWVGLHLSAENKVMVWIPEGFGHGFVVLSEVAEFEYMTTDYYAAEHERCILWNDPEIGIDWPFADKPLLSSKDANGDLLNDADLYD